MKNLKTFQEFLNENLDEQSLNEAQWINYAGTIKDSKVISIMSYFKKMGKTNKITSKRVGSSLPKRVRVSNEDGTTFCTFSQDRSWYWQAKGNYSFPGMETLGDYLVYAPDAYMEEVKYVIAKMNASSKIDKDLEKELEKHPVSDVHEAVVSNYQMEMAPKKYVGKLKIGTVIQTMDDEYIITGYSSKSNAFSDFEVRSRKGETKKMRISYRFGVKVIILDDVRSAVFDHGREETLKEIMFEMHDTALHGDDELNERMKPVTKRDWERADDEQREAWLAQAYDDPDDAEKFIDSKWENLPPIAQSNMFLESVSILEGSYEDFVSQYGNEVKKLLSDYKKIAKDIDSGRISQDKIEKAFDYIEGIYDKDALDLIDELAFGERSYVDLRDVANRAITMMNRTGTETGMIVQALEDFKMKLGR